MTRRILITLAGLYAVLVTSTPASALEEMEHRLFTRLGIDSVMIACGYAQEADSFRIAFDYERALALPRALAGGADFGDLCAYYARDDRAAERYHIKGWSVFNQLRLLHAADIERAWQRGIAGEPTSLEIEALNVVANYLVHHVVAMRLARMAGEQWSEETLRRAFIYEAMAIGYLEDAFSSGHMLVPLDDRWTFLHPTNTRKTHDAFCFDGVYQMNSKGEVHLGFGDKLAAWYAPTSFAITDAVRSSLYELLAVLLAAGDGELPDAMADWTYENVGIDWQDVVSGWTDVRDGVEYYKDLHLPTLLLVPMPISATWSVRTGGVGERFDYPQLADSGLHDPTLDDREKNALYERSAMPSWLVYRKLRRTPPRELIRSDPEVASVRYLQDRSYPPAFAGLLVSAASGWATRQRGRGVVDGVGLGYGLLDEFTVVRKVSVNLDFYPSYDEADRMLLSPSVQLALKLPFHVPFRLIDTGRFETGWAWGLKEAFDANGFRFGWGLEPATIPLGFTNAGVTVRVKYQWMFLETRKAGPQIELVLH